MRPAPDLRAEQIMSRANCSARAARLVSWRYHADVLHDASAMASARAQLFDSDNAPRVATGPRAESARQAALREARLNEGWS
jgi:hypothetical protein